MIYNQVIDLLKEKHKKSGGHCGIVLVNFGIDLKKLKPILNKLYKEKLISIHDNQHGKLIKYKIK